MKKLAQLYAGKAKTLYATDDDRYLIVDFRDDATAFNGLKKAELKDKGVINNHFNAFIMETLTKAGVPCHFVRLWSSHESVVKRLEMIKVECVIRNIAAGNLCKRLGIKEGLELNPPLFEYFLKDDALNDPIITEDHILHFGWATAAELAVMKQLTFKVNEILQPLFLKAGLLLVDYKLEFGRYQNEIVLGDEFSPDGCRIWDAKTRAILDKDRFRKDLGDVVAGYSEVAHRLGVPLPTELA